MSERLWKRPVRLDRGGKAQCRALVRALRAGKRGRGIDLRVADYVEWALWQAEWALETRTQAEIKARKACQMRDAALVLMNEPEHRLEGLEAENARLRAQLAERDREEWLRLTLQTA